MRRNRDASPSLLGTKGFRALYSGIRALTVLDGCRFMGGQIQSGGARRLKGTQVC